MAVAQFQECQQAVVAVFATIENGLGFQLVPWQPLLQNRIGQYITGVRRDDGGIEWDLAGSVSSGCEESKPA